MQDLAKIKLVVGIITIIIVFLVLKRIGLIKIRSQAAKVSSKVKDEQKAQKKIIETTIARSDLFKPERWKDQNTSTLLDPDKARDKAITIEKSWGWLNDDEDSIYGVFRSLTHKNQISQLAFFYLSEFGEDLASRLVRGLNKSELNFLWNIIDNI